MDIEATIGVGGGGGIPHGDELVRFAEAITKGTDDAGPARQALRHALGEDALVEASGIVGIFNGLVRNADFTGIPLDEGTLHGSKDFREALGLNVYAGAANTDVARADPALAPERFFAPPSD